MRYTCPFRFKTISFLFLFLAPLFIPLLASEGSECDCGVFERSLEEADKIFQELGKSPETAEISFLNCLDRIDRTGVLADYCANTFLARGHYSDAKTVHKQEKERMERLHKACLDARDRCREWKIKESKECEDLEGKERARCYSRKGLWGEFEARFSEEAREFKKSWEDEKAGVKNFLQAKSRICDEKYKENDSARERCVSNFKNKYEIQALLDSFARGKKPEASVISAPLPEAEKGGDKKGSEAKADDAKSKDKDVDSVMIGKWLCEKSAFIFEITKTSVSYKLACLAGCGNGEKNEWIKNFNFSRKYSKYNNLGTGYFEETCVFDDVIKEFTCNGTVRYVTKYGKEDTSKLEARHCAKIVGF